MVAARLRAAGLSLSIKKCSFFCSEISFLGFKCTREGLKADEEKVRGMLELAQPQNVKDVRAFMGMVGYYRSLIKGFAEMTAPLTDLLKKDVNVAEECNSQACLEAVARVKRALTTTPVLAFPRFDKPFYICCDASTRGIGYALEQRDGDDEKGKPRAISYGCRKLSAAEARYTVTEIECLAVVEGVRHFKPYIFGRDFFVFIAFQRVQDS